MRLFLILFLFSFSTHAGEILVATVAQVKNHVITSREVQIHNMIDKTLGVRSGFIATDDPVELLIREWLLFFEASSFYNTSISGSAKAKKIAIARSKLAKLSKWKKLGVTSKELKDMVGRRLESERLYLFKKKASVLPVSDSEVESEFTQNRIRYGNMKFEEVRHKIRNKKIQQNLDTRMNNWFEVLEKKYKVQRFTKYNSKAQRLK